MDPYTTLGLTSSATEDEIKKAFRKLASELHPDKNPGNAAKEQHFKEVNTAYQIVGDPRKRAEYDALQSRGVPSGVGFGGSPPNYPDFQQEFINELFNIQGRREARANRAQNSVWAQTIRRGDDIEIPMQLTLQEAVYGSKKTVDVKSPRPIATCTSCGGNGAEPGTGRIPCFACSGTGRSLHAGRGVMGVSQCRQCKGNGFVPTTPCKACSGGGKIAHAQELTVSIPAGVDTGQKVRLAGQGTPGSPPGDLYLNIEVMKHDKFVRNGANLYTQVYVPLTTALRGGIVHYKDLRGDERSIDVSPSVQAGSVIVAKGQGVQSTMGKSGDLYLQAQVSLPEKLSVRARKLLDELADEIG